MNQYTINTEVVLVIFKRQLDIELSRTGLYFWLLQLTASYLIQVWSTTEGFLKWHQSHLNSEATWDPSLVISEVCCACFVALGGVKTLVQGSEKRVVQSFIFLITSGLASDLVAVIRALSSWAGVLELGPACCGLSWACWAELNAHLGIHPPSVTCASGCSWWAWKILGSHRGSLTRRSKQVHAAGVGEKDESWNGLKEPPITAEGGEWCHHQKEQTAGGFCPLHCVFFHCWANSHLLGIASFFIPRGTDVT